MTMRKIVIWRAEPAVNGARGRCVIRNSWVQPGIVSAERSDLGSPYGGAGCPARGRLRGQHMNFGYHFLTAVPSQSACSADSSPKGRAKGAPAPVCKITICRTAGKAMAGVSPTMTFNIWEWSQIPDSEDQSSTPYRFPPPVPPAILRTGKPERTRTGQV